MKNKQGTQSCSVCSLAVRSCQVRSPGWGVSAQSDGLGQSVFPPFCLPPFRDGDSEGAFPASSQTPFNRQPRRPVLRVGSAATAPQLRRNEKTNAAALSSSTETQAPPPSEEGQLLFLKVQEQRLQSKVRRVTIPLGAFKSVSSGFFGGP